MLSPGIAEGPGVNDMKGGLVVMVQALRAMKAAGKLKDADITIVLTGDEERVGQPGDVSRKELVAAAERADVALEFEGLARVNGVDHGSISRRGGTGWTLKVTAKSGHSSQIFSPGWATARSTKWRASSPPSGRSCRSPTSPSMSA